MQFQAQLRLDDLATDLPAGLLLVFMCQNDPGGCDEWDPNNGGNRALVVPVAELVLREPPATWETLLGAVSGVTFSPFPEGVTTYDDARAEYAKAHGGTQRKVLGGVDCDPSWVQNDEVPECDDCGEPMRFVAQLEEGADHRTAMNFGGGSAYVFICVSCPGRAKFLWQQ